MRFLILVYSILAAVYVFALASARALLTIDNRDYHPERHYMRGPGPKWREKHSGKVAMR